MMDSIIRKFERFIKRNKEKLDHYKELESRGKLSNHGYYDLGYLQGKIYAYENVLDDLLLVVEENKKKPIVVNVGNMTSKEILEEVNRHKGGN